MAERREGQTRVAPALLLAGLIVLAFGLRFWRLGHWGLEGDEIYTLRDSLTPRLSNPRPLLYVLNHYLVGPLAPLDEFGLRVLPALAGVLAIPAFYVIARRLVGTRAALFGALLIVLNPMHIYQSQYARYWSLVFLFSAFWPYAIYFGARDHNARWMICGLVAGVLGVLAHPVSGLLVGGLVLFALLQVRRDQVSKLWSHRSTRLIVLLIVILGLAAAVRSFDLLQGWIVQHDTSTRVPDHLRDVRRGPVIKQLTILLGYVDGVTLPVVLTGMIGVYLIWRRDSHKLGLLLACLFLVPTIFILLVSARTPVSVTYLIPTIPTLLIGAGAFLGHLAEVDWRLRPQWLLPAAVTSIVIAAGLPTVISQYRDGRRYDFRGAARWLESRLADGDIVFSMQSRVTEHYLSGTPVRPLAPDEAPLINATRELRRQEVLWIIAPAPSHAFRTNLKRGGLIQWIFDNCQIRHSLGVGRLDFRQQYLHLYRCAPPAHSARVSESRDLQIR